MEDLILWVVVDLCRLFPHVFWAAHHPPGSACSRIVGNNDLDEITVFLLLPQEKQEQIMFEVTVRHIPDFCMDPDPVHVHLLLYTPDNPFAALQIAHKTSLVCRIFDNLKQLR